MDGVANISDIIVGDIRTGRETHTNLEKGFADAINISGGIFINWLLVHGFP